MRDESRTGRWVGVVLAVMLGGGTGCLVRDGGDAEVLTGQLLPGALCTTDPTGGVASTARAATSLCPACSTPARDGGCQDRWYASARRCDAATPCTAGAACNRGYCVAHDSDGDGLDDDLEREVATRNFPALYQRTDEHCGAPLGVVYRVRRHPAHPSRLAVTYVVLYDQDCGSLNGHLGDNEAFAITVDLDAQPGGAAAVGVLSDAHRGTACDSTSSCETRAATGACAVPTPDGDRAVLVFASRDKHANYLSEGTCERNCLDVCGAGRRLRDLPLVNAGEPDHPLVHDLSTDTGFISVAGGWDASLLHADPWAGGDFGGAGNIAGQLVEMVAPPGL